MLYVPLILWNKYYFVSEVLFIPCCICGETFHVQAKQSFFLHMCVKYFFGRPVNLTSTILVSKLAGTSLQ